MFDALAAATRLAERPTRARTHRPGRHPCRKQTAPEDTEVIDFFAPVREDFLTGEIPAYMA